MKTMKEDLEETFRLVSAIPVSGEAVDVMAVVRADLKAAYKLLEEQEGETHG